MAAVVETEALTKVYQPGLGKTGVLALKDLTMSVEEGEVFGLVGPNGSGKTTCLKILLGLAYPTKGKARLFGKSVFDLSVKERVGFMPEAPYFYDHMTGEGLLNYFATFFGMGRRERKERVNELLNLVGMHERRSMALRYYSRGMLQRIGLAQALLNDPALLILDEPTSGLDPIGSYQIRALIREMKTRGKTVLLCSHLLGEVEALCDRVAVLHRGNMLALGQMKDLLPVSERATVIAGGLSEEALGELKSRSQVAGPSNGMVEVLAQNPEEVNSIIDFVRGHGGEVYEIVRPRQTLEEFFIRAVRGDQEAS